MKKVFTITLITLVICLIGGMLVACGGSNPPASTLSHFAQNGIAFDYPSSWTVLNSDVASRIAFLMGTDTSTVIQVIKDDTNGYELKTYHDQLAMALMSGSPISGNPTKVAGFSGYETVFPFVNNNKEYRMRAITFQKDNYFYSLTFATAPSSFDTLNRDFNTVVSSFSFQ